MGRMTEAERIRLSKQEHETRTQAVVWWLSDHFIGGLVAGVLSCAALLAGLHYLAGVPL